MDENELLLLDRIQVIQSANKKYDLENNAYLSFSGGKDSTALHYLLDIALPGNKIPRVFSDTGIEYQLIREFVYGLAKNDERFQIIKPSKPITKMLQDVGYPFKSKEFSGRVDTYQNNREIIDKFSKMTREELVKYVLSHKQEEKELMGKGIFIIYYLHDLRAIRDKDGYITDFTKTEKFAHPKKLEYLFSINNPLRISNKCCYELKKKPMHTWQSKNKRSIVLTGMKREEGGQRENIKTCILTDASGNVVKFHPLLVVSDEWEDWFIEKNKIQLCKLYYPPYQFKRTGCKGCPYAMNLQENLDTMKTLLPNERKQCEIIWKPVYEEYRRIGFRLRKKGNEEQMTIFDED